MKKIKKLLKTFSFLGLAVAIIGTSVFVMSQNRVEAAVCGNAPSSSTYTGLGSNLALRAQSDAVESTTEKISLEFTPQQTWGTGSTLSGGMGSFATSSCTYVNSGISFYISNTALSIYFTDSTRTSAFVEGTDYKDLGSGVSVTSSSNSQATAEFNLATINATEAQQLSVDISASGWAEVLIKQGSDAEVSLVTFKLPADAASFYSSYGQISVAYSPPNANSVSCTGITGTGEV